MFLRPFPEKNDMKISVLDCSGFIGALLPFAVDTWRSLSLQLLVLLLHVLLRERVHLPDARLGE